MPDLVPIRRALISVSDKTDLVPFAKGLASFGVELISTGGTASALREAGLRVIGVEEVTGLPEMMDGRVKTLHPAIHGGLLARRDLPGHLEAMRQHGITPIDLVCVNLYPFEQTIRLDGVSPEEAIENIDIGGPAILRSSAKNHEFVTAVTSADQYDRVINEMRVHEGATSIELRRELAAAAFARTAEYDTTISAWMGSRHAASFPEMLRLTFAKASDLRYGENPHQQAAVYADPACDEPNVVAARTLHGKPLSYNNLLDAAAAPGAGRGSPGSVRRRDRRRRRQAHQPLRRRDRRVRLHRLRTGVLRPIPGRRTAACSRWDDRSICRWPAPSPRAVGSWK